MSKQQLCLSQRGFRDRMSHMNDSQQCEFNVDTVTGLIRPARQCHSPNQDDRPDGCIVSLLIVHAISLPPGEFGGSYIEQFFCNGLESDAHPYFAKIRELTVSAHLLIRRDGSVIQFVPFGRRAWHAGASRFRGGARCNDFSIGIELEGTDDTAYDDRQYAALSAASKALMQAYPGITPRTIAGHCDVAPGRKTDPGPAFDWFRLYDGLANHQARTT